LEDFVKPDETVFEQEVLERLRIGREKLLTELRRVIVGQDDVIEEIMIVLFSGSH
jgi:MoxR-like ATPase